MIVWHGVLLFNIGFCFSPVEFTRHVSCEDCFSKVNGGFDPVNHQVILWQGTKMRTNIHNLQQICNLRLLYNISGLAAREKWSFYLRGQWCPFNNKILKTSVTVSCRPAWHRPVSLTEVSLIMLSLSMYKLYTRTHPTIHIFCRWWCVRIIQPSWTLHVVCWDMNWHTCLTTAGPKWTSPT